jgi:multidrug resistance efflux pump
MNTIFPVFLALHGLLLGEDVPRIPVIQPQQSTTIIVPERTAQPVANKTQAQAHGLLDLHKRNHVVLAATERAVLMSLETEQRDANGNIVKMTDGQPVMVPVIEGMRVFKGQVLGQFDNRELKSSKKIAEAQLEVAKAERDKQIEVEFAQRGMQVAEVEVRMMQDANKRHSGTFPDIDVLKAMLEFKQAEANLELQKYTIKEVKTREVTVRESELDRADVLIHLRQIIAPIDGMVVKQNQTEGEWLREGDPVLEIVQLQTLQLRGKVSAEEYTGSELDGKPATVFVTLPNGQRADFPGRVVFVNPRIDPGRTFDVLIEVQNRPIGNSWQLQPGLDADAVIQLQP